MSFPLKDVRYTTRRRRAGVAAAGVADGSTSEDSTSEGGTGASVAESKTLYPRLLREANVLPKVGIAVSYFESLVGQQRQALDPEVLVQFFGDHKLARCIVAALATTYRYRSPSFAEVASRTALKRLERAGAGSPKGLRAHFYGHLNGHPYDKRKGQLAADQIGGDGFMRDAEQGPIYAMLEGRFGLRGGQLERLLYLDADEHAILTRTGAPPRPEDVVAQYNFGVLETLLRHAQTVELTLSGAAEIGVPLRALAAANDVDLTLASCGPRRLRLRLAGRADALGSWARHGRRLARLVVQLLERARETVEGGSAIISLRDRRAELRLTPEVLDKLVGDGAPGAGWDDLPGWDAGALAAAVAAARIGPARRSAGDAGTAGIAGAWGLRRLPEAQAWASGVIVPDVRLLRAGQGPGGAGAVRLCAVRSARHGARLAAVAAGAGSGEPLVFTGHPLALAPLRAAGQHTVAAPVFDLQPVLEALAAEQGAAALDAV